VDIDESVKAIVQKLSKAAEAAEDEDAPSMTYARGKLALKQADLVNQVLGEDNFEEEFAAEKAEAIAEDAPKEEDLTLPGWGSWTGQGVKRRATEKKLIKKIPGIEESRRKDAKLKNVIINERCAKAV
jgi:U3 small nucleolar RNA-associated protein 14